MFECGDFEALYQLIEESIEQKDKEHRKEMIEMLEGMKKEIGSFDGEPDDTREYASVLILEQINKLK
tara:strand:+ start:1989 stop:2189 length:201 start_codon:yes stop_codon:yes gene_type:complete